MKLLVRSIISCVLFSLAALGSLEAAASLPASRLSADYFGIWVVSDESRHEHFRLDVKDAYTSVIYALGSRSNGKAGKRTSFKIRSTTDRQLLITTRTGYPVMQGKLTSANVMSGVFSDGTKWSAKKSESPVEIWQLVIKENRKCGGFFSARGEAICEMTYGLGSYGANYVNWKYPTTFFDQSDCQDHAAVYWENVCPSEEQN